MPAVMDRTTTPSTAAAPPSPPRRRRSRRGSTLAPWAFTAPGLIISVLVLIIPIAYTLFLSVRGAKVGAGLLGPRQEGFVGADNYASVFADPEFWASLGRMLVYGVLYAPPMMALALCFALIIDALSTRWSRFARLALFLPFAVPGVVSSIMWGFMYIPAVSPIAPLFAAIGVDLPNLLGKDWIFVALANIGIWATVGFNTVIIYTALRTVPAELFDSARLDGCGEWRIAWHIKLPLIVPAILLTTMFAIVGTLQVYTEPQILRPLTTALTSTFMPLMAAHDLAFIQNDLYQAAAMSVVLALLSLVASVIVLAFSRRRTPRGNS